MRKASKILMILGAAFSLATLLSTLMAAAMMGTYALLLGGGMLAGFFASMGGETQYVFFRKFSLI